MPSEFLGFKITLPRPLVAGFTFRIFFATIQFMSELENKKDENQEVGHKVYEVGYLLVPTISPENAPAIYGNLKELVLSLKGEIISDEMPKMITLAYSMQKITTSARNKFNTAYLGWIKFSMDPEEVLELKKKLDLDSNFLRFLILKTVRENTIAAKRFVHRDTRRSQLHTRKEGEGENVVPINKEEIDKEIEAMVAN